MVTAEKYNEFLCAMENACGKCGETTDVCKDCEVQKTYTRLETNRREVALKCGGCIPETKDECKYCAIVRK